MSSCPDAGHRWYAGLLLACFIAAACAAPYAAAQTPAKAEPYPSIGRAATPKEITAWDIDVRPDFKGLPKGVGSVAKGMDVWEAKCASCHGVFGESNEVFSPIVGGTTADDVKTGHAARLNDRGFPGRTTLMKVATVSTLWDYINRAMPWNQPKSLTTEEVYAVTAYILNLGGVVDDNFVLSDQNIAQVQERMPNRKGMTTTRPALPAVTLLDGSRLDLSAPADVARVVVFWASYCPFCLRHNAHVEKLHRLAAGQRLQVLSVSQDTNPALVHPYLQRHGYTFPVTMDSTPMRAALSSRKVIPLTCALDRQGVLREMIPGEMFEEDVLGLIKLAA